MSDKGNALDTLTSDLGADYTGVDLFNKMMSGRSGPESTEPASPSAAAELQAPESSSEETGSSPTGPSDLMKEFESLADVESDEEGSEDSVAAQAGTEESSASELSTSSDLELPDSEQASDIEMLTVKGEDGRKRKLKIDYSDRKATKQAYLKAAGMRKFQAERDAALKKHQELESSYKELESHWSKVEDTFKESGIKGLVELLDGPEGWTKAVDEELAHRDYVANLSADEKYRLEMKKQDEQYQKQLAAERAQREQFQRQIEEREEQAALQALESRLHPAFDRYRFAGKLGDPETENLYDRAIWDQVRERLGEYPDELELSQAVIDKEFRTVASRFSKHIKTQTEKQVKKTVEKKKAETAHRAQVAAKKGLGGTTARNKLMQELKIGNFKNALDIWQQNKQS